MRPAVEDRKKKTVGKTVKSDVKTQVKKAGKPCGNYALQEYVKKGCK